MWFLKFAQLKRKVLASKWDIFLYPAVNASVRSMSQSLNECVSTAVSQLTSRSLIWRNGFSTRSPFSVLFSATAPHFWPAYRNFGQNFAIHDLRWNSKEQSGEYLMTNMQVADSFPTSGLPVYESDMWSTAKQRLPGRRKTSLYKSEAC